MKQQMVEHQQLSERQIQIIEEAIKLIAEEGIVNFTTKKLAQAVKVSEPAIYRHFKNKEAIIFGLIKYVNEKTQEIFNSLDYVKNKSSIEILELKSLSLMQFFYKNICCAKTSANPGMFFPKRDILKEINNLESRIFENMKVTVKRGQKEGDIKSGVDSGYLVKIIMGSHLYTIHKWSTSDVKYDLVSEWMKTWEVIKMLMMVEK